MKFKNRTDAKAAFRKAANFTVFQPLCCAGIRVYRRGHNWDLFEITTAVPDAVEAAADSAGIDFVFLEPQADDVDSPAPYDDFDASIDALAAGFWLVKIPDTVRSKYYRLFVVKSVKPPAVRDLRGL